MVTATGSDQGLGEFVGFDETADFSIHMQGTSLLNFNWADDRVGSHPSDTDVAFYLATHYNRPEAAYLQREKLKAINGSVNDVIDYTPIGKVSDLEKLPLVMAYDRRGVVVVRGLWDSREAAFLGFKGGNVSYHHSHMDLGSFVLEMNGVRFAIDLGSDSYALPEYFGSKRFTYYRLRNVGHNTLTFDDDNQGRTSAAEVTEVKGTEKEGSAIVHLTEAYAPSKVKQVNRIFAWAFNNGGSDHMQITDEIEYGDSSAQDVTWSMHTKATVRVSSLDFILTEQDKMLTVGFDHSASDCPGAKLATISLHLDPPQYPTTGISKLTISAPAKTCRKIVVNFSA